MDEVQRLSALLDGVDGLIEVRRLRFPPLGPSARDLKARRTHLLVGWVLRKTSSR